ncbi:MAG: hypothetical protein PVH85_22095 [Desulfobacterales bacterium]|jgi:hypothetical protein
MTEFNRRQFPRQNAEEIIQIILASDDPKGHKDSPDLIPAKMRNQSDEGFYIEIDRALIPGSNVRIKMVPPNGYHPEEAHYMRDGRIIRCEKVADTTSRFGVGIKILRKVIQARVLTSRFK